MDKLYATGQNILGHNMFAYCYNNPISYIDRTGNLPTWTKYALGFAAALAATCLVAAAISTMLPAAVCTLTLIGTSSFGLSVTTAGTLASTALTGIGIVTSLYAGDEAFASITGESLLLPTVFNGNEAA